MIAPRTLPPEFARWNAKHLAPAGRRDRRALRVAARAGLTSLVDRVRGPFAWQANNTTRRFEYPWVYAQVERLGGPLDVAEIGGGLAGMQWVLARDGHRVVNVDPGLAASGVGFALDAGTHERLSRSYRAPVRLAPTTIENAGIPDGSVDVLLSISTLEHLSEPDLETLAAHVPRLLRPTGRAILTVDLFLDLAPFTARRANEYGRNIDVAALLRTCGLVLTEGERSELNGFPEFDPERILSDLARYDVGQGYPALAQVLTARRAAEHA